MIFFLIHLQNIEVPLHWLILLALLFVSGVWAVILSLFKLDEKGELSCIVGAVMAIGFAMFAFLVAWREKKVGAAAFHSFPLHGIRSYLDCCLHSAACLQRLWRPLFCGRPSGIIERYDDKKLIWKTKTLVVPIIPRI